MPIAWTLFCIIAANSIFAAASLLSPAKAEPASPDNTRTYSMIGAMNICVLDALGVSLEKSLLAASVAVSRIIVDKHNSQFSGYQGANELWATEDNIRHAVASQVIVLVEHYCNDKLSEGNKKELQNLLGSSKALIIPPNLP